MAIFLVGIKLALVVFAVLALPTTITMIFQGMFFGIKKLTKKGRTHDQRPEDGS